MESNVLIQYKRYQGKVKVRPVVASARVKVLQIETDSAIAFVWQVTSCMPPPQVARPFLLSSARRCPKLGRRVHQEKEITIGGLFFLVS